MINRKITWSIYSEPKFYKPKPQKQLTTRSFESFHKTNYHDESISIAEIIAKLPKHIKLEDVEITIDHDKGSEYDSCEIRLDIGVYNTTVKDNPHYEAQNAKYKAEHKAHKEDVKEWKLWADQESKLQLERQIKSAKDFLEKHDKR